MSQSLRYLLDDNVDIYEKQVLKKQLVSELVCPEKDTYIISSFDIITG